MRRVLPGFLSSALLSCTGAIGANGPPAEPAGATMRPNGGSPGSGDGVAGAATSPGGGAAGAPCVESAALGGATLRRLTRSEYDNTIRDLLGDATRPADGFEPDPLSDGWDNDAALLTVGDVLARQMFDAAFAIARRAAANPNALLKCDPAAAGEETCVRAFLASFGKRAFRRPLDAQELVRFERLFRTARADNDLRGSLEAVVAALLASPAFLYRPELGAPAAGAGAVARLTPWETAARLSYFLWGSMPDDRLFQRAEAGGLQTATEIRVEASRMLDDPKARLLVAKFHADWLGLARIEEAPKNRKLFPAWTPSLATAARGESEAFLAAAFWDGGDVKALYSASWSYANAELARFYGVTGPAGSRLERVALDTTKRSGLLTQAGLLALTAKPEETSPVLRGKLVRFRVLCGRVPPPPPDAEVQFPEAAPNQTTRERFEQHVRSPTCAACHQMLDPIGFGLESFDAVGQWRTTENGKPIDASGNVRQSDVEGPFRGAVELGGRLAASAEARACLATHWLRVALGRAPEPADACTLRTAREALDRVGWRLREIPLAVVQTPAFRWARSEGGTP